MFKKNLNKLLLASGCVLLMGTGAQAEQLTFQGAIAEYKAGKYREALSMFRAFNATSPNNATVHYWMALCHHQLGHIEQAKQEYQAVVASGDPRLKPMAEAGLGKVSGVRTSGSGSSFSSSSVTSTSNSSVKPSQTSSAQKAKKVIEFYADW